jgi:DNA-binding HxlR family transcriptional regulator
MKAKSFQGMSCSIAGALQALGDRWAFLVLRDLAIGLRRYDDLQRSTQIPTTTLSERLKHLEAHELIERLQYQDNPPRFEYELTTKGRDFSMVMFALAQWGDRWTAGEAGPPVEFVDRDTGRRVRLAYVDDRTGHTVPGSRIEARPGPGADDRVRWRLAQKG